MGTLGKPGPQKLSTQKTWEIKVEGDGRRRYTLKGLRAKLRWDDRNRKNDGACLKRSFLSSPSLLPEIPLFRTRFFTLRLGNKKMA